MKKTDGDDDTPMLKKVLCGIRSPLGALAEFLVGSGQTCWCCSFWRGVLWGSLMTGILFKLLLTGVL